MAHELWSRHQPKIYNELERLAAKQPPVSLHDNQGHFATSRLRALVRRGAVTYLVLNRPRRLTSLDRVERVVYKLLNSPFMFFDVRVEKANQKLMSCVLPQSLYYLQRRRYHRYGIKNRGAAAFFLNRRAKVCHMELVDLSLGGARLSGVPRYDLRSSELIGPVTFSMVSSDELFVRELTINQAAVVRSLAKSGASLDVGLRFSLDQQERKAVADVLTDPFAQLIFR